MSKISCGVIIVKSKNSVLIVLENDRFGKFGFPKGRKNKNESTKQTAYRELKEETNVDLNRVRYRFGGTVRKSNVLLYIVHIEGDLKIKVDSKEIKSYEWIPIFDLYKKSGANPRLYNRSIRAFTESNKIWKYFRY